MKIVIMLLIFLVNVGFGQVVKTNRPALVNSAGSPVTMDMIFKQRCEADKKWVYISGEVSKAKAEEARLTAAHDRVFKAAQLSVQAGKSRSTKTTEMETAKSAMMNQRQKVAGLELERLKEEEIIRKGMSSLKLKE